MTEQTLDIEEEVPGKITYLQTHSSVRPYAKDNLVQVFADMRGEMGDAVKAEQFEIAAGTIGTHAPKIVGLRNKTYGLYLDSAQSGNRRGRIAASGNGALGKIVKVILRPISILEEPGSPSLFDRMQGAGDTRIERAFETVFGADALAALKRGLATRHQKPVVKSFFENYPVFFIPGEDGGDLQAAPGGSIEAHANMTDLKFRMIQAAVANKKADQAYAFGEWSDLEIAAHTQNQIIGASGIRTRFRASFPSILNDLDAEIWGFRQTGQFPRFRDDDAAAALVEFAFAKEHFEDVKVYRGGDIKERQVDHRAKFVVLRARWFVETTMTDLRAEGLIDETFEKPDLKAVISRLSLYRALEARKDIVANRDTRLFVTTSINAPEFRAALAKWGY